MRRSKKHWVIALLAVVLMVPVGSWLLLPRFAPDPAKAGAPLAASQDNPADAIDAVTYCLLRNLRQKLCLTNGDLAAMGCSQEGAENTLNALCTWYEAKKTDLAQARQAVEKARKDLREAHRKINVGPRDETLLAQVPTLTKALGDALKAQWDLIQTAVPQVEAVLASDRKSIWQTARTNAGAPGSFRYVPDITPEQGRSVHLARRSRARKLAAATTHAQTAQIESAYTAAIDQVLFSTQKTAMTTAMTNIRQNMDKALAASQKILPVPDELQPPASVSAGGTE